MKNLSKYPTILKLQQVFKMGYTPSRGKESYSEIKYFYIPNCFAHACFNLTNQQLSNFKEADKHAFRGFVQSILQLDKYIAKDLFDFVKLCGLKVQKSNRSLPKHDNEWKVAIYFGSERLKKDYHFLLQEKDGSWSGKHGETDQVTFYPEAPKYLDYNFEFPYKLYGIYKITNPYAPKKATEDIEKEHEI